MSSNKYEFSQFKPSRILSNNTNRKSAIIVGHFTNLSSTDQAILILEKSAFADQNLKTATPDDSEQENQGIFSIDTKITEEFVNDIYGNFLCFPKPDLNSIKVTIVYPATEKHIIKYSVQELFLIEETPALYENITLPHLQQEKFSLNWVYNILDHKHETERIVFEDSDPKTGFVLLPDLKWDGKTKETLYLLAICFDRNIKSLRELNGSHLDLLKNIQDKGANAIEERYGIKKTQLRIYIHYQPSFYHFHVHFTYLKHDAPGIFCEKSHLLSGVINNIQLIPDYYQKSTLSFTVREADRLFQKYNEEQGIKKIKLDLE